MRLSASGPPTAARRTPRRGARIWRAGLLPAVVVHSLLRTGDGGRAPGDSPAIATAYDTRSFPSRPACNCLPPSLVSDAIAAGTLLLTGGFTALTALLLFVTRQQPISRRAWWGCGALRFRRFLPLPRCSFGRHDSMGPGDIELVGAPGVAAFWRFAILQQA